jgi:hypothetical protein
LFFPCRKKVIKLVKIWNNLIIYFEKFDDKHHILHYKLFFSKLHFYNTDRSFFIFLIGNPKNLLKNPIITLDRIKLLEYILFNFFTTIFRIWISKCINPIVFHYSLSGQTFTYSYLNTKDFCIVSLVNIFQKAINRKFLK